MYRCFYPVSLVAPLPPARFGGIQRICFGKCASVAALGTAHAEVLFWKVAKQGLNDYDRAVWSEETGNCNKLGSLQQGRHARAFRYDRVTGTMYQFR